MPSPSDTGSQTAGTSSVLAYATMATASRAVTEAIAPAVLVSALATGHSAGQGDKQAERQGATKWAGYQDVWVGLG